jgi:hypothetical protein
MEAISYYRDRFSFGPRPADAGGPVDRHAALARDLAARWAADPQAFFTPAGITADPWQRAAFAGDARRELLLCSRQSGKSTVAGARAVKVALTHPNSLTLLLSPTLRQSGELFKDKVLWFYNALNRPLRSVEESKHHLELENGSRVISLPDSEEGIRVYAGVNLLVLDEASRISDDLYKAVRPMLAISDGALLAQSTPFGKRGWFFEAWDHGANWQRVRITANECPRITREFLEDELAELGERWYRQEYFCSFEDAVGAVFPGECIDAMFA